ncbi:MAG: DUF3179 domain-containing (seleno)protein [Gemmatimonadota bacterium]
MKLLFWLGVIGLALLEVGLVYFIMPLPGSQRMRSIELAYALYTWRWIARAALVGMIALGLRSAWGGRGVARWLTPIALVLVAALAFMTNVKMAADQIFRQPERLVMAPVSASTVALDRLVVGIDIDGQARAYPLQYIGYHHQVRDTIAGTPVLVSYCTVCRTGRVFKPMVNGAPEMFRLVGMDHFNAMFEDRTTRSWWRQANGQAIIGPLKGVAMPELPSVQVSLQQWVKLHPATLVMQGDPTFASEYAKDYAYERGTKRGGLTGTDTIPWSEKAWVVGIALGGEAKAYDWRRLRRERVINDVVGGTPIVLVMGPDSVSFFAFQRPDSTDRISVDGDSLVAARGRFAFTGRGSGGVLTPVTASQEFWHSWRTFQPATTRY